MSGWDGSNRAGRLPREWHAQRQRILREHKRICHVCGLPGADQVDHLKAGDDHSDANLRPIHKYPCHARKSSGEGGAASGKARRARAAARTRAPEKHPGILD